MKLKTILKELDKALQLWEKGAKVQALERLYRLRNRIAHKVQEEQERQEGKNSTAGKLADWYYGLWQGKIPEGNYGRVVNVFKDLLERYKLPEEEIKETYLWWLNLDKDRVPKYLYKTYSIVLTDRQTRAITDFRGKLRHIKGLKNELEGGTWTSPENERGMDYYIRQLKELGDDGGKEP